MSLEWRARSEFPGLVKSPGLVVGPVDPGQRRQYRGLVPAVPPAPRTADRQSRQHVRHRAHAAALRGLCVRLRIQVVPSARGRAADLLVRHLAVERCRRPLGRNRGRDLLRGAVGDYPAPARHDDGSGHHLERRVGDRAVDPDRGMLLMVCGADHQLSAATPSKIRSGRLPSSSSGSAFAGCCRSSMVRFAWSSPSRSSGSQAIWRFS